MQVTFNSRKILPTSYEGKNGIGFNTTIFTPVQYGIRFGQGVMPLEHMKAVMTQAAENAEEVEIDFVEGRNSYGSYLEIFAVRPLKNLSKPAN